MLKLQLSKEAVKFLNLLPPKQFRQIVKSIFSLLENPRPADSKDLRGYPLLRNDIGEYRIIYDVHENATLRVILVGKRNDGDVYRKLG